MSCDFMVVFASDFHKINNIEKIMMFFLLGSAPKSMFVLRLENIICYTGHLCSSTMLHL